MKKLVKLHELTQLTGGHEQELNIDNLKGHVSLYLDYSD